MGTGFDNYSLCFVEVLLSERYANEAPDEVNKSIAFH